MKTLHRTAITVAILAACMIPLGASAQLGGSCANYSGYEDAECSATKCTSLHLCCRSTADPLAQPDCYLQLNGALQRDPNPWGYPGYSGQPADATSTEGLVQDQIAAQQNAPVGDVIFKPQISLPGSKFIAGEEIAITGATLGEYIAALYAFIVGAIGIIATLMVMYGGLRWLTAGGNTSRVQDAKDQIVSAIIGVVLAFSAYLILLTISPKLVKFRTLELTPIAQVDFAFTGDVASDAKGSPQGHILITNVPAWLTTTQAQPVTYSGTTKTLGEWVTQYAAEFNVPEKLIYGIMYVESGGRIDIGSSSAGACGLMQLLPSTAGHSCQELGNGALSVRLASAYLKGLIASPCPSGTAVVQRKDGSKADCDPQKSACGSTNPQSDPTFVIAAYNGGQGANCHSVDCEGLTWWQCEANTGYAETRYYVEAVKEVISQIP